MRRIIIPIQSISDIITNSSSEVFVINANNDSIIELINALNDTDKSFCRYLKTTEDVKEFLIELIECNTLSDLSEYLSTNLLYTLFYDYSIKDLKKLGIDINKVLDTFMPAYEKLLGKLIIEVDDYWETSDFIQDIIGMSKQLKLIEYRQRV